ncbi:MAG: hypothetical protein KAJ07_04205 [Planctomycetes bacterium]|nr:hypothetical protein [Planctomycetota bacterium]
MKKLVILIIAVVLNGNISIAFAGGDEKELGISYDVTWVSKYIWRGQDIYDDHAAHGGGAITADKVEGFTHLFGFSCDLPDLEIIENPLTFSWDITYNDGQGSAVDHDWSHMTWGLSTSFEVGSGTITPALYYQTSMEKTINTEDEFWVGISYGFEF